MNKWLYIILIIFSCPSLRGQESPYSRCEIEGEDVYIRFHESCLNSKDEGCASLEDFKKYNLDFLIRSGKYTTWSEDGWTLQKTGAMTYQLHKKLSLFDRLFSLEDKFNIDISYWLFPVSERLKSTDNPLINEPVRIDVNGNVGFVLKGRKNAKEVILSGTFNNWNEKDFKMVKTGNEWKLTLQLPAGIYEYKFIVDGEWITDPENNFKVPNPHQTYNSILLVGKNVEFYLNGYPNAKKITLSGSFNNWNERGPRLTKTKTGWKVTQKLPPGKHYYKFIIDGHNWIIDPDNKIQERDNNGYINSVMMVHQ
jgi:hypothetical protein